MAQHRGKNKNKKNSNSETASHPTPAKRKIQNDQFVEYERPKKRVTMKSCRSSGTTHGQPRCAPCKKAHRKCDGTQHNCLFRASSSTSPAVAASTTILPAVVEQEQQEIFVSKHKKEEIDIPSFKRIYELVNEYMNKINLQYPLFKPFDIKKKISKATIDRMFKVEAKQYLSCMLASQIGWSGLHWAVLRTIMTARCTKILQTC
ncbi:hypothetical protein BDC45DRAFT_565766 [Circinella umbellata]|nr:hypothetical protein BDC45DRAFT_565766 [Circinella umbellata]